MYHFHCALNIHQWETMSSPPFDVIIVLFTKTDMLGSDCLQFDRTSQFQDECLSKSLEAEIYSHVKQLEEESL